MVDMDRFEVANDPCGPDIGDGALRAVGDYPRRQAEWRRRGHRRHVNPR
jgi:hypothetical protein